MSACVPQFLVLDTILDEALPQLASAAERGQLTHSQFHKLHSFVETIQMAHAYKSALSHPMSLSRIIWGDVNPHLESFFSRLPNEIMIEILCFLSVEDILSLRMTCKRLCSLTRLRHVWHSALHRHVVHAGLPVPSPRSICGARYHFASSLDLELRTVHATRLHMNLTSDNPQIKRAVQLHTSMPLRGQRMNDEPLPRSLSSVLHVAFFDSSHGQQYLVAAFSIDCLGCWEISPESGSIFHVAQWQSVHGAIADLMVNDDTFDMENDTSQGMIAVASMDDIGLIVTILRLDKFRGVFVVIGSIANPNSSFLCAFKGNLLAFSEDTRVINWRVNFSCRLIDQSALMEFPTLSMRFIDSNFIIVVGDTSVSLFLIPAVQAPLTQSVAHPIASFALPFTPYEAVLSGYHPQAHGVPISDTGQIRRHPVSLLLRSQQLGVSVVYHYVFGLEPREADGRAPSRPVRFPPTFISSVPVSRSCSNLHLSPSGRGYWLETRNVGSKRRSYPARCVIPLCITCTSTQDVADVACSQSEQWHVELKVGAKSLYERQCGWKDLKDGKQNISAIALDDSVGRMAVGDVDGGIVVLDYA